MVLVCVHVKTQCERRDRELPGRVIVIWDLKYLENNL